MAQFETYEEALEAAADLKVEIADIFKPQHTRLKKIFEGLWKDRRNQDLTFPRDMMLYQAGYPEEDSKAKIEKFRDQLVALIEVYSALDLLDNLNSYFQEVGVAVELVRPAIYHGPAIASEKGQQNWDNQFFGETMPTSGTETLSKIVQASKTTQFDINTLNQSVDEIAEQVEEQFGVKKTNFKRAADLKFAEKTGKSVEDKLDAITEGRKALDKALEPFTGE